MTLVEAFARLEKSSFRRRFRLSAADVDYIKAKGLGTIRRHAEDFIRTRLAPAHPANDGKQTPMRGHPVFVAQHATATCCRSCMNRWWHVTSGMPLTQSQQTKIANLIMAWIARAIAS